MAKIASLPIAYGQATTVTASDTIATGLKVVRQVIVSFNDPTTLTAYQVTADVGDQSAAPVAGSFLLKTWKPTSSSDATILAASVFSRKVNWVAFGD